MLLDIFVEKGFRYFILYVNEDVAFLRFVKKILAILYFVLYFRDVKDEHNAAYLRLLHLKFLDIEN